MKIKLFIKVFLVTLAILLVGTVGIALAYYSTMYKASDKEKIMYRDLNNEEKLIVDMQKKTGKNNRTIAICGLDFSEKLTDVIIVLNYNSKTNKVNIIRIPRDTRVEWTDRQKALMEENIGFSKSVSKINEMYNLGGTDQLWQTTIAQIEGLLGVKVDNYAMINLSAFRNIVDAIGGVEIDVPQNMKKEADHLDIDLKAGIQKLDGHHAEMLVRYRDYKMGDLTRIEMQNEFMKEFVKKLTSGTMILKLPKILPSVAKYIETDISLVDLMGYLPVLSKLDSESMEFYILPGTPKMEKNTSYYFPNNDEINKMTTEIVINNSNGVSASEIDKTVTIEILNGSGISKVASKQKDILEKIGYKVSTIGNYERDDLDNTIIYAKDKSKAVQFNEIYKKAVIKQNKDLQYDIQIIIGKDIDDID